MGEAKRRKQIDSSYGKIPSLRTERDRRKNFEKIVNDLYSEFGSEIKALKSFDKISNVKYLQIFADLDRWVKNRLSNYCERDQEKIADFLLTFMFEMLKVYDINPILFVCFANILKSYISPALREKLSEVMKSVDIEIGSA